MSCSRLGALAWPADRRGEAVELLAAATGLGGGRDAEAPAEAGPAGGVAADDPRAAAAAAGLELEATTVPRAELGRLLAGAPPALLRLPAPADGEAQDRYLALAAGGRRWLRVIAPDRRRHRVRVAEIERAFEVASDDPRARALAALLGAPPARKRRGAAWQEPGSDSRIRGCWLLRQPPGAPFGRQLRRARVPGMVARVAAAHAVQHLLLVVSWWVLGRGVLEGRLDPGWLVAWAGLLLSITPFRALELVTLAHLTTHLGALLRRRLMAGVLELAPEEVRHQGAGAFLGRVIDSEAVESLALSGGHMGLVAGVELVIALPILAAGAGGVAHAVVLVVWLALALALARRYARDLRRWTAARLAMTHDLVEGVGGHKTRLAQSPPETWHGEEDRTLEGYLALSGDLDRRLARLRVLVPRGWLLAGMLALAPAFVAGNASPAALAVGVGGVLFAHWALSKLVHGVADLARAAVAWRNVQPLFAAAARAQERPRYERSSTAAMPRPDARRPGEAILVGREITFGHRGRARPVLEGCDLEIAGGDRVLLEGASGSGKSTLASLVAGLRAPDAGLLLLDGLDRETHGRAGWRRRVAAAPQFHDNHVLAGTLAFNLLMGRGWPPRPEDLTEAEAVCRELGLGELIDRMPAGLQQMVGEAGWQLSHGEKSRLYLARALLQGAELVVLDESLAALDPATLRQAMGCVLDRAPSLLLVAHP